MDRRDYEIIVVDGGSTDGTVEKAGQWADLVVSQRHQGIGGARRDGADVASGEMLAFTDADTSVCPRWLEAIEKNLGKYDASTGPVVYADPSIRSELLSRWRDLYRLLSALNFYYMLGSNMAVRSDVYRSIGGHSEISLLDDYDLSVKLRQARASCCYDEKQAVMTSSRRAGRMLAYTLTVAYGHYHYRITSDHQKLLEYPRPEEMTVGRLIDQKGKSKELIEGLESLRDSVSSTLRKMVH